MQTNGHRRDETEARKRREERAAARRRTAQLMDIIGLEAESGISRWTWRDWIRARRIESITLGRAVRVRRKVYEAYLQANRVKAR